MIPGCFSFSFCFSSESELIETGRRGSFKKFVRNHSCALHPDMSTFVFERCLAPLGQVEMYVLNINGRAEKQTFWDFSATIRTSWKSYIPRATSYMRFTSTRNKTYFSASSGVTAPPWLAPGGLAGVGIRPYGEWETVPPLACTRRVGWCRHKTVWSQRVTVPPGLLWEGWLV